MSDYIVKAISESGSIRAYAVVTTELVNKAYKNQKPAALAGIMLGRALSGAALLGGTVKNRERVALKFEGNGPLVKILTEADGNGNIRGYVGEPSVDFTEEGTLHEQLSDSIGNAGMLSVTKDLGLKQPFTGVVHLVSGEIGQDIAFYLTDSEQIPSAVAVGAIPSEDGLGVDIAGGFLVQAVPQEGGNVAKNEANIEAISTMIESFGDVTAALASGKTPEDIIKAIFAEVPFKFLDKQPLRYLCGCSKDRFMEGIKSLGSEQIQELAEDPGIVVSCEFCKESYDISPDELKELL